MTHTMVVGTTETQELQVLEEAAVFDFTGITIGLAWRATAPTGPIAIDWLDETVGTVEVTGTGSMTVGRYPFRFTLTDGGGKVSYVPNLEAEPNIWWVVRV